MKPESFFWIAALASLSFHPLASFAQGSLTPPGAPAPTMKSLDQIEPRIPIDAAHISGDANYMFIITNAGSYYLTTNIVATSAKSGIRILADNVIIDLNGFGLDGGGVGNVGIINFGIAPQHQNITIRNGTIRNWSSRGIDMGSFAINVLIENILVRGCGGSGIVGAENSVVRGCLAYSNGVTSLAGAGISAGTGSVIVDCVANANGNGNTNSFGIAAGSACTISHCSASQNNGLNGGGISGGLYATVIDCTAGFNSGSNGVGIVVGTGSSVIHCTASHNNGSGGAGISASERVRIESCTATDNSGDGIRASNECFIVSNHCGNNGGAAIHTTGIHNRVDGNNVTYNPGGGIKVDSNQSLIVRNSVSGNAGNNYIIAAGNNDAVRLGGGTNFTSTDPWANFSF
jgi:hypothetical protein